MFQLDILEKDMGVWDKKKQKYIHDVRMGIRRGKDKYDVGDTLHVYNRGAHKLPIFKDEQDKWNFLQILCMFNATNTPRNWRREFKTHKHSKWLRPENWPPSQKIVDLHGFCLHDNHYHLIVSEIIKGGLTSFMRRIGTAYVHTYNVRHKGSGTIFQGSYKRRIVTSDDDLHVAALYVLVDNVFEQCPEHLNIDETIQWMQNFPFSSFGTYMQYGSSPIITTEKLKTFFEEENKDILREYVASLRTK